MIYPQSPFMTGNYPTPSASSGFNPLDYLNPVSGIVNAGLGIGSLIQNGNIARDNLQFQRENLEYQKTLQQQLFEREDTAYQRTVNDMRSAGLSPLSMSGTNGAGSVVSTNAPQRQGQDYTNTINAFNEAFNQIANVSQVQQSIINSRKQNELLTSQINSNNIDNTFKSIEKTMALKALATQIGLDKKALDNYDRVLESNLLNQLASTNNLNSSTESLKLENLFKEETHNDRVRFSRLQADDMNNRAFSSMYKAERDNLELSELVRDITYKRSNYITDSMDPEVKKLYELFLNTSFGAEYLERDENGNRRFKESTDLQGDLSTLYSFYLASEGLSKMGDLGIMGLLKLIGGQ